VPGRSKGNDILLSSLSAKRVIQYSGTMSNEEAAARSS
jgi:hypothetical protein